MFSALSRAHSKVADRVESTAPIRFLDLVRVEPDGARELQGEHVMSALTAALLCLLVDDVLYDGVTVSESM